MSQQGPLPYLRFCGVEVANAARTIEYLRNGLGNTAAGHWEIGDGTLCSVLYRVDDLSSGCVPATFVSPAADPAPWYDPAEPGAETFLGAVLLGIDGYDSTINRSVTQRLGALGGGIFGRPHRKPREWKFRAALVSADDAGAEYGLRWLTHVLKASECAGCATCNLAVRVVCPPGDCTDDSLGEWVSYDVALVTGPTEVEQFSPGAERDALGGCREFTIVEFTLVAGNAYLYKAPIDCFETTIVQDADCENICDFLFGSASDAECCIVEPPSLGTMGAVFTLTSAYGFGSLLLEAYEDCTSGIPEPALQIQLSSVPADTTVIVDSARHRITIVAADGTVSDGTHLAVVAEDSGLQWLEIRDCDTLTCFCIRAAAPCAQGSVDVLLQTQVREG